MNRIYLYEGDFKVGDGGFDLVRQAASFFADEAGMDFDNDGEIIRDEKGKPHFVDSAIEFSLSHSGQLWICLFSEWPCGVDIQFHKQLDYISVAKRFFLPDERAIVEKRGRNEFFRIWSRKEALCKMTGQGLFGENMQSTLTDEIIRQGVCYRIIDVEIEVEGKISCAACVSGEPDIKIRLI